MWYTIYNRRVRFIYLSRTVELIPLTLPKKFIMEGGKNLMEAEKNFDDVKKKLERKGAALSGACLFYDLTPGGSHDAGENFREFIDLILYCNEKKLYAVRDSALRKIRETMII